MLTSILHNGLPDRLHPADNASVTITFVRSVIIARVGNGPFVSEFGGSRSEDYCDQNSGVRSAEKQMDDAGHDRTGIQHSGGFGCGEGSREVSGVLPEGAGLISGFVRRNRGRKIALRQFAVGRSM